MAGELTRHFGENLARLLADRFEAAWPEFPRRSFLEMSPSLEPLPLMKRVERIATGLRDALPDEPTAAWEIMRSVLPEPLGPKGKTFVDGYWMLPLAEYWTLHQETHDPLALLALEALTQRGTAEFAIRSIIDRSPALALETARQWARHESFHVRRLASEGTRPILPWKGKLSIERKYALAFREIAESLLGDEYAYVRRSAKNHLKDWKRIEP